MRATDVRIAALLLVTVAVTSGCGVGDARANTATVRDSAGITIVESSEAAWRSNEALVLAAEPDIAIGEEDAGPEYQFGRVTDAKRLSDGTIAVLDGMAAEIRYYDAQGRFIRKAGGKGGGPGEYQFPSWLRKLPGDSLLVNDMMAQRLTIVAPDASVGRTVNMAAAQPPSTPMGGTAGRQQVVMMGMGRYMITAPFADGTMLARVMGSSGPPSETSVSRDSLVLVRLNADGTLRDTVGTFAGDERITSRAGSNNNFSMMIGPPPFGKSTQIAVDGDGFYVGSGDAYVIDRYDAEGRLVRSIRRPVEPLPVTPADIEARKERDLQGQVAGGANEAHIRQMIASRWENAPIPKTMPAHGDLRVDAAGRLWVREIVSETEQRPRYNLFDRDGRFLGTVMLPERFRILDIGEDWVLGAARDELDLEQVQLIRLRPARS